MGFFKLIPPLLHGRLQFFTRRTSFSLYSSSAVISEVPRSSSRSSRKHLLAPASPKKPIFSQESPLSSPTLSDDLLKLALAGDDSSENLELWVKEMIKFDPTAFSQVLVSLISRLCSERKPSEALRIFKTACLEGNLPSISVCGVLMNSFSGEDGDLKSVVFVYKEIVKSGGLLTVDIVNPLIIALFRAGFVDHAMNQFRRMKKKKCAPDCRTFETVIMNLCLHGRLEESTEVLDQMIECSFKPDPAFFSKILPVFCKNSRSIEAKKLFKLMNSLEIVPHYEIYCDLIICFCGNEELDDAVELLDEMRHRGISAEPHLCTQIANRFLKLGRFAEAEFLLEKET
ncbi:uncharacterized protein LOC144707008 [Wolffia australiana]